MGSTFPHSGLPSLGERLPAMAERLQRWADLNTGSTHAAGLRRFAPELAAAFRELGSTVELLELPAPAAGPAIRAVKRPDASRRVLLSGHYDTVFDPNHAFQTCDRPEPDVLRGPGVADMKGGLVVMLEALRAFERMPEADRLRLGWEVLLTPDEELGSPASASLLRETAARHRLALVFEPALPDGSIVSSRKGVGIVTATARGRAAHAGRDFNAGRNAITALARFIVAAHELNRPKGDVIVNVGAISGGGAVNIVPDHALAQLNVRATTRRDGEILLAMLERAAREAGRTEGATVELSGGFSRPPLEESTLARPFIEAWCAVARELGIELRAGHSGGGSDANLLAAAGLACLDGLGPEGGGLHSEREWIRLSSLPRRATIAAAFLCRLARAEIALSP